VYAPAPIVRKNRVTRATPLASTTCAATGTAPPAVCAFGTGTCWMTGGVWSIDTTVKLSAVAGAPLGNDARFVGTAPSAADT
jgi:hypothetical protein